MRPPSDPSAAPMKTTVSLGSQNDANRAARAFGVGRSPSSRNSGSCSIHFHNRAGSIGALASGAVNSTT
jgi:hypothetical protein